MLAPTDYRKSQLTRRDGGPTIRADVENAVRALVDRRGRRTHWRGEAAARARSRPRARRLSAWAVQRDHRRQRREGRPYDDYRGRQRQDRRHGDSAAWRQRVPGEG